MDDIENIKDFESLVRVYDKTKKRLDRIIHQSDSQQKLLIKLNDELNEYKHNLELKVEEEIQKRKEKEKMLFQQSKLAAIGEMIDAVAHQWKQPINIINMQVDMLGYDFEDNLIDKEYIDDFKSRVSSQVSHMVSTLDEFRTFFRPNKDIEEFNVEKMINKVLLLVKDELQKNTIQVVVNVIDNFSLNGIENEFKHLILNLINNAKDAFNDNNISNRQITINILKDDDNKKIEIVDNAGGIPEEIIDDIFKANFTTKEDGKGTGIGLYMSSQIAMKHHGMLKVENIENGVKFIFSTNI